MEFVFQFVLDVLIGGAVLWLASKVTSVNLDFKETLMAAGAAALVSLIPVLGWILSIIILLYLLSQYSGADIWPDIILMVIVSRLIVFLVAMLLTTV